MKDPYLNERDRVRSSTFRVLGFGADLDTTFHDEKHNARDRQQQSGRGQRAFTAVTLTMRDGAALSMSIPNLKETILQTHFSEATVKGVDGSFNSSSLCYDSKWLGDISGQLKEMWCSLHRALSTAPTACNKFDIMAWLSTMAYAKSADMRVIQALVAFYKVQEFASLQIPLASEFKLALGSTWKIDEVESIVKCNTTSFDYSAESSLPRQGSETDVQHLSRIQSLFGNRQKAALQSFLTALEQQWPVRTPSIPSSTTISTYLDAQAAMGAIVVKCEKWYNNRLFLQYLEHVSQLLARQATSPVNTLPRYALISPTKKEILRNDARQLGAKDIFAVTPPFCRQCMSSLRAPSQLTAPLEPLISVTETEVPTHSSDNKLRLEALCRNLQTFASAKTEIDYVAKLRASCAALDERVSSEPVKADNLPVGIQELLRKYLSDCKTYFEDMNDALGRSVNDGGMFSDRVGLNTAHSARLFPRFWLSQLHRDRFDLLSEAWKTVIIEYGLAITHLHRATRLVALSNKPIDLYEELHHIGHSNWDPMLFPETLLLEAESGIMVRKEQEFIAGHMRSPGNGTNIVLQLLMGGGKSSTIVPILAAYLTDKEK
jgi:hypothetical protein